MAKKLKRVRGLVLKNYIASAATSFVIFALMVVFFGFDLEDQIFDYQVSRHADELQKTYQALDKNGETGAVGMEYFIGTEAMPGWMRELVDPAWEAGTYEIFAEELGHFHVAVRDVDAEKLFLLFNARPYIRSTPQLKTYLKIIAFMGGLAFLVSLFFMHRMTKRLSEPLEKMAAALAAGEKLHVSDELADGALSELKTLVDAIQSRDSRIQSLLERERQFNRDASHELRTPLAVATGAVEVMEAAGNDGAAFGRLKTALADMRHLTDGILWLSRDASCSDTCPPLEICKEATQAYRHLLQDRKVQVIFEETPSETVMPVPKAVAQVMIGNLVRNAFSYTDKGVIAITISDGSVAVRDTGVGFGKAGEGRKGFGIGLSLVERLCTHFGLILYVGPAEDMGTAAVISWGK